MKKKFVILLSLLLLVFSAAAGGLGTVSAEPVRVALVLQGNTDWPGWYYAGYRAVVNAQKKYGFELSISEMVGFADMERVFTEYAVAGYDLIWAHASGYEFGVPGVAENFSDVHWLMTGNRFEGLDNVVAYDYQWRDVTYLWGYLAALMSETGVIGMSLGEPHPAPVDLALGVKVGFLTARPEGKFLYNVVGSWGDPDTGREVALAQIDQGADIVCEWAGTSGIGIGVAAKERNVFYIPATVDFANMQPDVTIGYAAYCFERPINEAIEAILNDAWVSGSVVFEVTPATLPVLDFYMTELVPQEIRERVEAERQRLMEAGGVSNLYPDISEYAIGDTDGWRE